MEADLSSTSFLPAIYDIFKCLEKDPHDLTVKINEMKSQIQKSRETVDQLPGVDLSKKEQLKRMEILKKQYVCKTELVRKYRNNPMF